MRNCNSLNFYFNLHETRSMRNRRHSNYFSEMKRNLAHSEEEMKFWWINKQFLRFLRFIAILLSFKGHDNSLKFHDLFSVMKWKENCSVDVKRRKLNEKFLEEKLISWASRWHEHTKMSCENLFNSSNKK